MFCGSSRTIKPVYAAAARQLGQALVQRELGLVYGGGATGLMGILADTVLEHGGEVIGVMPQALVSKEVVHRRLTRLHLVDSLEERKRLMSQLSNAFLALPGGFGTLDEIITVLTAKILGLDDRPLALWNVAGYWNRFLEFLDYAVSEGMIRPWQRELLIEETELSTLLERILAARPAKIL